MTTKKRMKRSRATSAKRKTTTKAATTTPTPTSEGGVTENKKERITSVLQREEGATLAELMRITGWQAHSVRGFISGTLRKKLGLTIDSRREGSEHRYKISQ